MKTIVIVLLMALSTGSVYAKAEINPDSKTNLSDDEVEGLIREGLLVYLKNKTELGQYLENPDGLEFNHFEFKPNEYADEVILVQVIAENDGKYEHGFGVFYKDAEGNYTATNYSVIDKGDHPCRDCDLEAVETPEGSDPVGVFIDHEHPTGRKIKLGYNLREMYFYFYFPKE